MRRWLFGGAAYFTKAAIQSGQPRQISNRPFTARCMEIETEPEKDEEAENERKIDSEVDRDRGLSH
jgi:hypothetical protein